MNNYQKNAIYSLVLLSLVVAVYLYRQNYQTQEIYLSGVTMGQISYQVKYTALNTKENNFQSEVDSLLKAFNQSLSTYIEDSEISTFNKKSRYRYDSDLFYPVLQKSQEIFEATQGSFDPTVAPLVNAWGFGFEKKAFPDSSYIDSLKTLVGFDKITFNEDAVSKEKSGMMLDFSAIAKGYAVDKIAEFLERKNIENYLVIIGGEARAKGKNISGESWRIGIVNPQYRETGDQSPSGILPLNNQAVATSGNYENFYIRDGRKYAHTIDPKTGYPVEHSLLSASVIAADCMTADAYATAFMVMGLDKTKAFLKTQPDLQAFLIYADDKGNLQTFMSEGKAQMIAMPN